MASKLTLDGVGKATRSTRSNEFAAGVADAREFPSYSARKAAAHRADPAAPASALAWADGVDHQLKES